MKKSLLLTVCMMTFFAFVVAMPAAAYDNVTPAQAYDLVVNDAGYYLVDIRTAEEWKWVGHPGKNKLGEGAGLDGKVVNVAYKLDWKKQFILNPSFLTEIDEVFGNMKESVTLILMCRSGDRSVGASLALEAAGYRVANMLTGFEGGADARGYRTKNGWALNGLPYSYSSAGVYED